VWLLARLAQASDAFVIVFADNKARTAIFRVRTEISFATVPRVEIAVKEWLLTLPHVALSLSTRGFTVVRHVAGILAGSTVFWIRV
jgi:hypothetical protein